MTVPSPCRPDAAAAWLALGTATLVGSVAYGLSCLVVANAGSPVGFGAQWQEMSSDPLELRGLFPHRMLSPLLANLLGLGGARFLTFVHALSVLWLATVCFACRRRGSSLVDSALVTLAIAATGAVQMYKTHWVGFPDALGFTLALWSWLAAKRPAVFWALFAANLLQHELALFLLPWSWFLRREAGGGRLADGLAAAGVLALYAAFYLWVRSSAAGQVYDAGYFAKYPLFPGGTAVVLAFALSHLLVAYGPLLAVLGWHHHERTQRRDRWHLALVGAGIVAIFCIAYDWSRHANLIAIPLVIAARRFVAAGHRGLFASLVALLVVASLLVPPWAQPQWPTSKLLEAASATDVIALSHRADGMTTDVVFGPLSHVLTRWLPAAWPTLVPIVMLATLLWTGGAMLGSWRRAAVGGEAPVDRAAGQGARRTALGAAVVAAVVACALPTPGMLATAETGAAQELRQQRGPAITFVTTYPHLARDAAVRATCVSPPAPADYTPDAMWRLITREGDRVGADYFVTSPATFPAPLEQLAAAAPGGSTIVRSDGGVLLVQLARMASGWLESARAEIAATGSGFELTVRTLAGADLLGVGFTIIPPAGEPALLPLPRAGDREYHATLPMPKAATGRWRFVPGAMQRDGIVLQGQAIDVDVR